MGARRIHGYPSDPGYDLDISNDNTAGNQVGKMVAIIRGACRSAIPVDIDRSQRSIKVKSGLKIMGKGQTRSGYAVSIPEPQHEGWIYPRLVNVDKIAVQ